MATRIRRISLFPKPEESAPETEADRKAYDRKKQEEFDKQPAWKRAITDIPYGIGEAILGKYPSKNWSEAGISDRANIATQALGLAAPIFGMTKYLGAGRVPNVAARQAATDAFKQAGTEIGVGKSAAQFANRYPRIAAHMDLGKMSTGSKQYGVTRVPLTATDNPRTQVLLNTDELLGSSPEISAVNTIYHEGGHVAQQLGLGNKDFNDLYRNATNSVGYANNPFERSARAIGTRGDYESHGLSPRIAKQAVEPVNARHELAKVVANTAPGSPERQEMASIILRRRDSGRR